MNKFFYALLSLVLILTSPAFCKEKHDELNALVDIGGGRKVYMECIGSGSPTVILIAGYRERGDSAWNTHPPDQAGPPVYSEVGKFTRVCTYDRPGVFFKEKSRSDPISQPMTVKSAAIDLHTLLKASNVKGPYVIVGHSLGGLIAKFYAAMYPTDICGVVFVDALVDTVKNLWTPEQFGAFKYAMNFVPQEVGDDKDLERLDLESSFRQATEISMAPLSKIPAIVLTSDKPLDVKNIIKLGIYPSNITEKTGKQLWERQVAAQDSLVKSFSPLTQHIKNTHSGHYIQKENPGIVIDAIREIMDNAPCKSETTG